MPSDKREIYQELLIVRCQRGDSDAWEELIGLWQRRLMYYLRRMIDREADAWNVLQEVWLHVWRGVGRLQDPQRFAPWVYLIARRTAMRHFRDRYRHARPSSLETIKQVCDTGGLDELEQLQNVELVHFGLQQLELREREVLTLYFLQDLSIAQMAEVLEIPTGTVKSRLFKARGDLRRVLERETQRHE